MTVAGPAHLLQKVQVILGWQKHFTILTHDHDENYDEDTESDSDKSNTEQYTDTDSEDTVNWLSDSTRLNSDCKIDTIDTDSDTDCVIISTDTDNTRLDSELEKYHTHSNWFWWPMTYQQIVIVFRGWGTHSHYAIRFIRGIILHFE